MVNGVVREDTKSDRHVKKGSGLSPEPFLLARIPRRQAWKQVRERPSNYGNELRESD